MKKEKYNNTNYNPIVSSPIIGGGGVTLFDQYAGQAMQAIIPNSARGDNITILEALDIAERLLNARANMLGIEITKDNSGSNN